MYKIIYKSQKQELLEARDWCRRSNIEFATSFDPDIRPSPFGMLTGETERLSYYFAFAHKDDALMFLMLFGGKIVGMPNDLLYNRIVGDT
jgi:hypothetical protein